MRNILIKIDRLNQNINRLYDMGEFELALESSKRVYDITKNCIEKSDPLYVSNIEKLAQIYYQIGDYHNAEKHFLESKKIKRRIMGESNYDYIDSLVNLGVLYSKVGKHKKSKLIFLEVLRKLRIIIGENHPDFVIALNNLGVEYRELTNFKKAIKTFEKAIKTCNIIYKKPNSNLADSLDNLANVYSNLGDYDKSRSLVIEAIEIRKEVNGEKHKEYAHSLESLALVLWKIGDYPTSESLFLKSLKILQKTIGEDHVDYAKTMGNLAGLYYEMGKYSGAIKSYRFIINKKTKAFGKDNPSTILSVSNLAKCYKESGNFSQAKKLFKQVLKNRRSFSENPLEIAATLEDLAGVFHHYNDLDKSEKMFSECIDITRKKLGEKHPDLANRLDNYALLCKSKNNFHKSKFLLEQSLKIKMNSLGIKHPSYARTLDHLGMIYLQEQNPLAVSYIRKALKIRQNTLGNFHPSYADSLQNLALFQITQGRPKRAINLLEKVNSINDNIITELFTVSSEREKILLLEKILSSENLFISTIYQYFRNNSNLIKKAFELILRRKGLVTESMKAQRSQFLIQRYPDLSDKLNHLTELQRKISNSFFSNIQDYSKINKKFFEQMIDEKESLENELTALIPEFENYNLIKDTCLKDVIKFLPENSFLVEYVQYHPFIISSKIPKFDFPHYLAFVVSSDESTDLQLIDLGAITEINNKISSFKTAIYQNKSDFLEKMSLENSAINKEIQNYGVQLRNLIFDPLIPSLLRNYKIIIAPEGEISQIPFDVLPTNEGGYVIDHNHRFSYLTSSREIVLIKSRTLKTTKNSIVIADPNFDLNKNHGSDFLISIKNSVPQKFVGKNMKFKRLKDALIEGNYVANKIKAKIITGDTAVKKNIKLLESPQILHIATHSFFLDMKNHKYPSDISSSLNFHENPLLFYGLALAGANNWNNIDSLPPEAENGLLTALDITGMDLSRTDMVVLSACDTGLGKIQMGEGVFGLRRSLVISGAKTQIISMWKVPDKQTAELMKIFYDELSNRKNIDVALHESMQKVRTKNSNPYYWGAFICQGNTFPIKLLN